MTSPAVLKPAESGAATMACLVDRQENLVWTVNLEYRLTSFNQAFADYIQKVSGHHASAGDGSGVELPPELAAKLPEMYERTLMDGTQHAEFSLPGGCRLALTLNPILRGGKVVGVSGAGRDTREYKRAILALEQQETLLNLAGEIARVGGWELEPETGRLTWTPQIFRIHEVDDGYPATLESTLAFYIEESRVRISEAIRRALNSGDSFDLHLGIMTAKGNRKELHVVGKVMARQGGSPRLCGTMQDTTERRLLEETQKAKVRELELLSEMNSALRLAGSERELLQEYCRILVELGGYRMAWVGFAEDGSEKRVRPVAHYGQEDGYLSAVSMTWDDSEYGQGPTGEAIRTSTVQYSCDFSADPRLAPWWKDAGERGYRSSIALPFHNADGQRACLTAYGEQNTAWAYSEQHLLTQVAVNLGFGIKTLQMEIAKNASERELRSSLLATIQVISETVDQRDPYTAGHQHRVADLCYRIAGKLGLSEERTLGLSLAATIHDLGKMGVPAELLSKPGKLTAAQSAVINEHVQFGYEILKHVQFPWPIADIIHQHHERLDGSGYPLGLTSDQILLESKILAVADSFEAMSSHRPYRQSLGPEHALEELLKRRGTQYDPDALDACVALIRNEGYTFPC